MKLGRIIIITGSPGTGKSTAASIIAKQSNLAKSVHMHTDDFYQYIQNGVIPPYLPEAQEQNSIVIEAFLEAAKRFARGGYEVIIDGIVGPWFLKPWQKAVEEQYEVHYMILRATKEETLLRAINREKLDERTNISLVETMWAQFNHLERYEAHIVDTSNHTIEQTVAAIQAGIEQKCYLLSID